MAYQSITLHPAIEINNIVTIHYFEYQCDFSFDGESHNFWEFLCVDKGEVNVTAGERRLSLQRGEIIFHQPDEFHNLSANHRIAPNLMVVSFFCNSSAMDFFRNKVLSINDYERELLGQVIREASGMFLDSLDNPYQTQMVKKQEYPFGSEQMIQLHLELFLLHLLRRYETPGTAPQKEDVQIRKKHDEVYHRVIDYLSANITKQLTLEQICRDTLTGRSKLQAVIRAKHNCGVIVLFSQMKITEAKQLIRNNYLNFTEISDALGYTSVHYFSRQFKKLTGMTPSEYSNSIKSLAEH